MSRTGSRRLLLACQLTPIHVDVPFSFRPILNGVHRRAFSKSTPWKSDNDQSKQPSPSSATRLGSTTADPTAQSKSDISGVLRSLPDVDSDSKSASAPLSKLSRLFGATQRDREGKPRDSFLDVKGLSSIGDTAAAVFNERFEEPHHFHVYATKHNTHITLTRPNRNPMLSLSCGNIGFKKGGRKHYDSAFQLASYVMGRIQEQGWNAEIKKLEVVLRGFGAGREAVTKALLGMEGRNLRGKVSKVTDATRLKFGGTRSRKPRRLG